LARYKIFISNIATTNQDIVFHAGTPIWGANSSYSEGYPDFGDLTQIGRLKPSQPTDGWHWFPGSSHATREGVLWGGCIEVLEMMKGTRYWPRSWADKILFRESSEDVPTPTAVSYWLRNYGIQGVFSQIRALLVARPHIPAKKRFVFLITADKIQPIENFR